MDFEDSYDLYSRKDNGSSPIRDFRHSLSSYEWKRPVQQLNFTVVGVTCRSMGGWTLPSSDTILRPVTYVRSTREMISNMLSNDRTIGTLSDPRFACLRSDSLGLVNLLGAYCASIRMHNPFIRAFQ